jgi:hypothetical protein
MPRAECLGSCETCGWSVRTTDADSYADVPCFSWGRFLTYSSSRSPCLVHCALCGGIQESNSNDSNAAIDVEESRSNDSNAGEDARKVLQSIKHFAKEFDFANETSIRAMVATMLGRFLATTLEMEAMQKIKKRSEATGRGSANIPSESAIKKKQDACNAAFLRKCKELQAFALKERYPVVPLFLVKHLPIPRFWRWRKKVAGLQELFFRLKGLSSVDIDWIWVALDTEEGTPPSTPVQGATEATHPSDD